MISVVSRRVKELRSHSDLYWKLVAWLGPLSWREAPLAIVVSSACAIVGVFLQSSIAIMIVSALRQAQESGYIKHFPWIKRIGLSWPDPPIISIVLAVTGLMILTGLARFLSRHIAIAVDRRIYTRVMQNLLEAAARPMSLFDAYQRRKALSTSVLQRAVLLDARFCGVAVRVMLYNVTQLGQLCVGLGILIVTAPVLLGGVAALVLLGIALVYPLNLHAVQISRNLETMTAERAEAIRSSLDEALQYRNCPQSSPLQASTPAFTRHLLLQSSHLRVIELSRLTMAFVLAVALGLFVWFGMESAGRAHEVLPAFVGFYFALIGIQGLAVTATVINRFLPGILRVYKVRQSLMTERSRGNVSGDQPNNTPIAKMPWRIDDSVGAAAGCPNAGTFKVGEVYGILARDMDLAATMFQLIDIVSGNKRAFADACETYLNLANDSADQGSDTPDQQTVNWIAEVMAASDLETKPAEVRDLLAASGDEDQRSSAVAHFLNDVAVIQRLPSPLAFVDGTELSGLGAQGADLVCAALRDKMTFFRTRNLPAALHSSSAHRLFVSDGQNIRCALAVDTLTEAAKDVARDVLSGRVARRQVGAMDAAAEATLAETDDVLL